LLGRSANGGLIVFRRRDQLRNALYFPFKLSWRDIEDLRLEHCMIVTYAPTTEGSPRGEGIPWGRNDPILGRQAKML
jgi:hypothetical protein